MKINLNMKLDAKMFDETNVTYMFPREIDFISKKYDLNKQDIYISDHPCGEYTIFSLQNKKIDKWLGYIDYEFYKEMDE